MNILERKAITCEIKSPQHKDGKIHHWHYQKGIFYPELLKFIPDHELKGNHEVHFRKIQDFKAALVCEL